MKHKVFLNLLLISLLTGCTSYIEEKMALINSFRDDRRIEVGKTVCNKLNKTLEKAYYMDENEIFSDIAYDKWRYTVIPIFEKYEEEILFKKDSRNSYLTVKELFLEKHPKFSTFTDCCDSFKNDLEYQWKDTERDFYFINENEFLFESFSRGSKRFFVIVKVKSITPTLCHLYIFRQNGSFTLEEKAFWKKFIEELEINFNRNEAIKNDFEDI